MRVRFKNRNGHDRWADIEDVTMLIKLDGTVVTGVADAYCSERLLTPEETEGQSTNSQRGDENL